MHDVPDRNFGGHQADEGSGRGGDGRSGADLALSGRAAHLQGNDSILTPHVLEHWSQVNLNHLLTHRQSYIYFFFL